MFNYAFLKTLDILYIESDDNTKKHFSNMLSKQFNSVVSVTTGKEAIDLFKKNKDEEFDFNIIICDTKLEDSSGLKVLQEIRSIDLDVPVILTTNKIEVDGLLKAFEFKATDYLEKPINAKDLVFSVERICQNKYHDKVKEQTCKDLVDIREVINEVSLVTKTDLDGKITFANKFFCEVTGYEEDELIGQTHDIIKDKQIASTVFENIWDTVKSGKIWEGKLKNFTKNKEEFYVYLTVIPIFENETENILEYMWICFLATEDEMEQKEFKKKVAKNIHASRRINTEARDKIDELMSKIISYKNMETSVLDEKQRGSKFVSQIKYYKHELVGVEEKLKETSDKASAKIKVVLADEKEIRTKKDKAANELDDLTQKLNVKNKSIKTLTGELEEQVKIIEKLMRSIDSKEDAMGMN